MGNTFSGNEVISAVLSRRSTRAYTAEQIEEQKLQTILECAFNAPSARNAQELRFSLVTQGDTCKKLFALTRWAVHRLATVSLRHRTLGADGVSSSEQSAE